MEGSLPHSQEYNTCPYPRQINPFLCPSHFWQAQLVSYLVGLRTYQHPGIFAEYNQQDATFHNLFISVRRSTCFRRVFRPSPGAQNCTYNVRYLSDQYCYLLLTWPRRNWFTRQYWSDKYLTLYVQFWAPGDGRKTRLKHVERLTQINK